MSPVSDISSSILSQLLAKNTASSTGKSQVSSQRPPPPPSPWWDNKCRPEGTQSDGVELVIGNQRD